MAIACDDRDSNEEYVFDAECAFHLRQELIAGRYRSEPLVAVFDAEIEACALGEKVELARLEDGARQTGDETVCLTVSVRRGDTVTWDVTGELWLPVVYADHDACVALIEGYSL